MTSFTLNSPWYEYVRDGIKIYEGRSLKNPKVCNLRVGDRLIFTHHTDSSQPSFERIVTDLHIFPDFRTALQSLGLENTLPGVSTVDEGVQIYLQFVTENTQIEYGVCMIKLGTIEISQAQ